MMTRYLSYETKSINIISCYIHYREILRQELFLGMITLCLENGIRQKLKSLESNIEKQEEYMEDLLENKLLCEEWVNTFLEKPSLGDLDRDMLLQYVEKINVFEGKKIEIVYRFQDELVTAARLAEQIGKTKQEVAV